ncbi:MAG: IclR family transcriptional regulator domain-containing protein [Acidimicrobiales bacterium]
MPRRSSEPNFIEALARGLDVLCAFQPGEPVLTLSAVASRATLARPTARRILITLTELGYVRAKGNGFTLTAKVLDLGMAFVQSLGLWEVARPHMERLVAHTHESSSIAQLDGSDIVYVARVAVPKIVGLGVSIGTRFPAGATSLGKVLLAALPPDQVASVLAHPSRSGVSPRVLPSAADLDHELTQVRAQGWSMTDGQLEQSIRSVAAPVRNGQGRVIAALNVNTNAYETSVEKLLDHHLPLLLQTAAAISADWARLQEVPHVVTAEA